MDFIRLCFLFLISSYATQFFTPCGCRRIQRHNSIKKLQLAKYWDVIGQKVSHVDVSTNSQPYTSFPFTLPLPDNAPPLPPSPAAFEPPVIYPPPSAPPPPPPSVANTALWCVAKPSVPDPIIREAMSYACETVADCGSIEPDGPCFRPNTILAHASYAFNSYWQKTKVGGGGDATCQFGGTAILVTLDPSYDECHFVYT